MQQSQKPTTTQQILTAYMNFYKTKNHAETPNVSLVPQNDSTLLFVNSGMFPLVPYLSGQPHPLGKRLVNVQRCLRFEDLDNVGNTVRHTTAFHMIGNWSFGDYFKDQQLPWAYEFLIEVLQLEPKKLYSTVFAGDNDAPKDEYSVELLKNIFNKYAIEAKEGERIFAYGKKDNWWQRGEAVGELGGPDSEVFYYIGTDTNNGLGKNLADYDDEFLEIGNSVFMEYQKGVNGWEKLAQKNVDFGGGLERLALVAQQKTDIFETDNFWPIIEEIQKITKLNYKNDPLTTKFMRVIADHIRSSTFLAMDGVLPSNKDQGYILRRLIRRMIRAGKSLKIDNQIMLTTLLVPTVVKMFNWLYPQLTNKQQEIINIFEQEEIKFKKTLNNGSKQVEKALKGFNGSLEQLAQICFDIYQSHGYPEEIFIEDAKELNITFDEKQFLQAFKQIGAGHAQNSRQGAEKKFKGGLAEHNEINTKYHTATHLLQWALKTVLGQQISQKGSNITNERLRFDINYNQTLNEQQINEIQNLINEKINQNINVNSVMLPKDQAIKTGALHLFGEKYPDNVTVYYFGDDLQNSFSKEFCGGPHVKNTSELLPLQIFKQQKIGENLLRIYAKF